MPSTRSDASEQPDDVGHDPRPFRSLVLRRLLNLSQATGCDVYDDAHNAVERRANTRHADMSPANVSTTATEQGATARSGGEISSRIGASAGANTSQAAASGSVGALTSSNDGQQRPRGVRLKFSKVYQRSEPAPGGADPAAAAVNLGGRRRASRSRERPTTPTPGGRRASRSRERPTTLRFSKSE